MIKEMSDFREMYKRLGFGRDNALVNRMLRSKQHNDQRHERRSQLFSLNRDQNQNLEEAASKEDTASTSKQRDETAKTNNEDSSIKQLAKWRKEKYRRKLREKKAQKPPFKVGVVHHRLYSPPLSNKDPVPSPPSRLCKLKEHRQPPVPKMVTKATQNRRAIKALESKEKLESRKIKKSQGNEKVPLAPKGHEFKAPEGINAIPLFGKRALEAARQSLITNYSSSFGNCSIASFISEEGSTLTPNNTSTPIPAPSASLSPFMACRSNEDIAKKDRCNEDHASPKKLSHGETTNTLVEQTPVFTQLSSRLSHFTAPNNEEECTDETLQKSEEKLAGTDFSKQEEYTTQHYRCLLHKETERLNGLCHSWELVKNEISTPEDIHYLIQSAIGQTQLLIGKKFKRFGGLVQDCETGEGGMPVTCKDLLGFWELMYIEVEDCNARFNKLEELKANGWIDKESSKAAAEQLKQKPAVRKATVAKRKVTAARSNSLKAHIVAARKKMQSDRETVAMTSAPGIRIQDTDNLVVAASGDPDDVQGKALTGKDHLLSNSEQKIPKIQINEVNVVQEKDENTKIISLKAATSQATTPMNKSVLRKVHLSQARKSSKSPMIALKISQMCKTPEVKLDISLESKLNSSKDQLSANAKCLENCEKDKMTIKRRLSFNENDSGIASTERRR